jgi:hypothetical protein
MHRPCPGRSQTGLRPGGPAKPYRNRAPARPSGIYPFLGDDLLAVGGLATQVARKPEARRPSAGLVPALVATPSGDYCRFQLARRRHCRWPSTIGPVSSAQCHWPSVIGLVVGSGRGEPVVRAIRAGAYERDRGPCYLLTLRGLR